jgi:hypothetical protein
MDVKELIETIDSKLISERVLPFIAKELNRHQGKSCFFVSTVGMSLFNSDFS